MTASIATSRGSRGIGTRGFARTRLATVVLGTAGVIVFFGIWELASRTGLVDREYLPPFTEILATVGKLLGGDPTLAHEFGSALGTTLTSWAIGLLISLVLGIVVGVVIGSSRWIREYTSSTIEFLRPIPSVGLIPVAIVMFGVRPSAAMFIIVWACFWVLLIHVISGVADVDPVADATARSYGLNYFQRAIHVVWPTVLPYLMTGLRLAATVALVVSLTIEIVVGVPGIGKMISDYQSAANSDVVYALALLAGVLGLVINLLLRWVETSALGWHPSVRSEAGR